MRSFKYHDYRGVRIVIFLIVLAALLLLVYKQFIEAPLDHSEHDFTWVVDKEATCLEDGSRHKLCKEHNEAFGYENIPATGHIPGVVVRENEVAATCTKGDSHDLVVYCEGCDIELSRETVHGVAKGHKPGTASKTNVVNPTHTVDGSYDMVTKCVECKVTLKTETYTTPATGHSYSSWEAKNVDGKLVLVAQCYCGETGSYVTLDASNGVEYIDSYKVAPCHGSVIYLTYNYEGILIKEEYQLDPESHIITIGEGEDAIVIEADSVALYDETYGKYFVYGTEGIKLVIDSAAGMNEDNVWDENGFAMGRYFCDLCGHDVSVLLYSAEHDTRLNTESGI